MSRTITLFKHNNSSVGMEMPNNKCHSETNHSIVCGLGFWFGVFWGGLWGLFVVYLFGFFFLRVSDSVLPQTGAAHGLRRAAGQLLCRVSRHTPP